MTSIVVLPKGVAGLSFKGSPPRIQSMSPESPLRHQVSPGLYVHGLVARTEQVVYSGIPTATELGRLVQKHKHDVRVLVLSAEEPDEANGMTITVTLPPATPLGLVLLHTRIAEVRVGSPLEHVAMEGMYLQAFSAPDIHYLGLPSSKLLAEKLQLHRDENPRKLVMAHQPLGHYTVKLTLPVGPLRVRFQQQGSTVVVQRVDSQSPLVHRLSLGDCVARLEVPNDPEITLPPNFRVRDVNRVLHQTRTLSGRILTVLPAPAPHNKHDDNKDDNHNDYPSPVVWTMYSQPHGVERLGKDTVASPEMRVGYVTEFCLRTGLPGFQSLQDAYHVDDWDGQPFLQRNFRFVEEIPSKTKDLVLQDGDQKIGCIVDLTEGERHGLEILSFHPRVAKDPSCASKFQKPVFKWAILRDCWWKQDISHREICMWDGSSFRCHYVVRNLSLSKHHLEMHRARDDSALMAVLYRRTYMDGSERHKWMVSLAPGVDPCFMMIVSACLDRLIVHL